MKDISTAELTARNRALVESFADIFYRQRDVARAFAQYVSEEYVQHNPDIPDGRAAAISALAPMFSHPEARFEIKRILVDGDLAMIHVHGKSDAAAPGGAVADIFRLEDGKIVEHWDVVQPIPESAVNPHPMF